MDPVLKAFDDATSRLRSRYSELVGECTALRAALAAGQPPASLLLDVDEAGARLHVGRTMVYRLIKEGRLKSVRVGGKRLIPADAMDEYLRVLRP